jgi:AraC-like DNA-binding protein
MASISEPNLRHLAAQANKPGPDDGMRAHSNAFSSPAAQILCAETRSWTCLRVSSRLTHCQGAFRDDLTSKLPCVIIVLEEVGGRIQISSEADEPTSYPRPRGAHISILPAGINAWQHSAGISMFRDLVLEFEPNHIPLLMDEAIDVVEVFAPRLMFFDSNVLRIGELIDFECQPARPADTLYGDSLCVALLIGLSRIARKSSPKMPRGGLASWQLKRSFEYLESHLTGEVSLKALADLAQVSLSHFHRAFKASTGVTPLGWLRNARIRFAQHLLVDKGWPLAQIALETGFADQAHLTRVFCQVTGENPGAWRRARLQSKF